MILLVLVPQLQNLVKGLLCDRFNSFQIVFFSWFAFMWNEICFIVSNLFNLGGKVTVLYAVLRCFSWQFHVRFIATLLLYYNAFAYYTTRPWLLGCYARLEMVETWNLLVVHRFSIIGKIVLSICGRDDETDMMQMILTCCITLVEPYLLMILEPY